MNSTNENNGADSTVDDITRHEAWSAIYVSVALTAIQVVFMLTILEFCRRTKIAGHVYDRRRQLRPKRTPPPLMQQRSWCFEWWRIRISDPIYRKMSQDEAVERRKKLKEQTNQQQQKLQRKHAKRTSKQEKKSGQDFPSSNSLVVGGTFYSSLTPEENRQILQQAERICFRESPFFDPTEDDNDSDRDDQVIEDVDKFQVAPTVLLPEEELGENYFLRCKNNKSRSPDPPNLSNLPALATMSTASSSKSPSISTAAAASPPLTQHDSHIVPPPPYQPSRRQFIPTGENKPVVERKSAGMPWLAQFFENNVGIAAVASSNVEVGHDYHHGEKKDALAADHDNSSTTVAAGYRRSSSTGTKLTNQTKTHLSSPPSPPQQGGEPPRPLSASERRKRKHEFAASASAGTSDSEHLGDEMIVERKIAIAVAAAAAVTAAASFTRNSERLENVASISGARQEVRNGDIDCEEMLDDEILREGSTESTATVGNYKNPASASNLVGSNDVDDKSSSNPMLSSPRSTSTRRRVRFQHQSRSAGLLSTPPKRKKEHKRNRINRPSRLSITERDVSERSSASPDAGFGTEEAARLARLRYELDEDVKAKWDVDFFTCLATFVRRRILMLQRGDKESDDLDDDGGGNSNNARRRRRGNSDQTHQEFLAQKVYRRPLSPEQEEMLRCIGLDAFMTLRFLEFSFDVSFWPFLFSLVTLIPTFATGGDNEVGFFRTTTLNLARESERFWAVVVFGIFHFLYILRRIWIEWEIFIPLRYDFLENGDFDKSKYQDQYRHTCLVEYVPRTHKHDRDIYKFFDAIFPGQVKRAEVLLNTEHLRSLIEERQKHLMEYENIYAQKVHKLAEYMRQQELVRRTGNPIKKWCHKATMPRRPMEPLVVVVHQVPREETGNVFFEPFTEKVRDPRTYEALPWHHYMIRKLNKQIDDEYIRLAQDRRRVIPNQSANWFGQWLGIGYMMHDSGVEHVHSSTAFVEFRSAVVKQQAIQCNLTGTNRYFELKQVPEIRDIRWENAHVAQSLIDARKMWANVALVGGLIVWSLIVAAIRSIDNASNLIGTDNNILNSVVDTYLPAMIVEGLVRVIPFIIKAICIWIRFKATSEVDHYVVRWYFGFRLLTFVFVIVGGTVVDSGEEFVEDPMRFLRDLSKNVAENSEFFISYIIVAGGMQIAVRISQLHNVVLYWLISKSNGREEATSQRRLDQLRKSVQTFHLEEFIPLFLFIFMVSALYGSLAPLACLFASVFFKSAYKVFKYMTLYVYGNNYEGGGFLFYTLNKVMFVVLYFLVLVLGSYLSLRGTEAMAALFTVPLLVVIAVVHVDVNRTFVAPSTTLSLARACVSDTVTGGLSVRERKLNNFLAAKEELERLATFDEERGDDDEIMQLLLPSRPPGMEVSVVDISTGSGQSSSGEGASDEEARRRKAIQEMERRYQEDDAETSVSDVTESDVASKNKSDFFIYRQPSLNRATWEVTPRPYRENLTRIINDETGSTITEEAELWG